VFLSNAGLYRAVCKRQPSGGSIGAIVGPSIKGNRRTRSSAMNRVDDSPDTGVSALLVSRVDG